MRGKVFHLADRKQKIGLTFLYQLQQKKKKALSTKNYVSETVGIPFLYSELVCQLLNSLVSGSEMEGDGGLVDG